MESNAFNILSRIWSFKYAYKGLIHIIRYEHNFRVHIFIAFIVFIFGIILNLSLIDWVVIILVIGIVLVTEILNTAIERIVDHISPEFNVQAGIIKDIGACAVLISALIAFIAGLFIFIPHIVMHLKL
jgi:undecaprenol kinase/diacylglycerol kinase (ATP)